MKAVDIIWDVDGEDNPEEILENLPAEIDLPKGMTDIDEISDYISDETGFCHKGFRLSNENPDERYPVGAIFHIEGDSRDMWLKDYNVRVSTNATVLEESYRKDKKVYVQLDNIDHDANVCVFINKKFLTADNRIRKFSIMEIGNNQYLQETDMGFSLVEKDDRTIFYDENDAENALAYANDEFPGAFTLIDET